MKKLYKKAIRLRKLNEKTRTVISKEGRYVIATKYSLIDNKVVDIASSGFFDNQEEIKSLTTFILTTFDDDYTSSFINKFRDKTSALKKMKSQ